MNDVTDLTVRRFGAVLAVGALVAGSATGLAFGATTASAATGTGVSCVSDATFPQFDQEADGYSSFADCVVPVPDRTVNGQRHAGVVEVDQTGAGPVALSRLNLGLGPATAGDRFGASIAVANLDGDKYHDLLIGAPGVANGAGRVYVVYGSANGLGKGRATRVLGASVKAGSEYGASMVASLGYDPGTVAHWRVLVGAPGTKVGTQHDAGAVYRYSIRYQVAATPQPATLTVEKTLTESVSSVLRPAKANERFGAVVTTDLCGDYVGAPGEVVGTKSGAGAVVFAGGGRYVRWTQDTAHVAGSAEKGDAFGASVSVNPLTSRVAIGAPGEDVGKKKDAGSVTVISQKACPTSAHNLTSRAFAQGSIAHTGSPESGDRFGASVRWTGWIDYDFLSVGAPNENIGSVVDAGAVVRYGFNHASCTSKATLCGRVMTQSAGEFTGTVGKGHLFGATIGTIPVDDGISGAVVGAPGDNGGRGALSALRRSGTIFDTSWLHPHAGDRLGSVSPIG